MKHWQRHGGGGYGACELAFWLCCGGGPVNWGPALFGNVKHQGDAH